MLPGTGEGYQLQVSSFVSSYQDTTHPCSWWKGALNSSTVLICIWGGGCTTDQAGTS